MREQAMRDVLCDCFAFVGNKIKDGTVTIEDVRSMFETVMSSTGARHYLSRSILRDRKRPSRPRRSRR